jgi:predicted GNAT superfamily acetyltransferase
MKPRTQQKFRRPPPRMTREGILIRNCRGIEEFVSCVRLEREVWKSADIDVVPIPLFVVASETGGQVLGAFHRNEMVGFTMAIVGWRNRKPFLHSHMTAVSEAYQDQGIGRQLKLFQRSDALDRGISLVEWTFDPLATKNAYFNFMVLGAIARRYIPNAYGITTSPLHGALPTDRLVAEWHLRSPRVLRLLAGKHPARGFSKKSVRISIPASLEALKTSDPAKAAQTQSEIRAQFTRWFGKKYAATAVSRTQEGVDYILEPPDAIQWANSALLEVREGRHNVAHRGSGGKNGSKMVGKPRQG